MSSKFSYRKTILFGFGFLGISVVWPIFNRFIPLFLQAGNPAYEQQLLAEGREIPNIIGFGLAPSLAFFIMTWDNLINVFVQPWVGARSDRTWNRFGRRKGWILLGLPIALIGFIAVPYAASVLAIALFILITNFGMALFRSPTVAWLGDLIPPEHRGKANGAINLMGGIGFVIASFVLGGLFDSLGRPAPFLGGAIVLVVALLIPLIWVEEPEHLILWQNLRQIKKHSLNPLKHHEKVNNAINLMFAIGFVIALIVVGGQFGSLGLFICGTIGLVTSIWLLPLIWVKEPKHPAPEAEPLPFMVVEENDEELEYLAVIPEAKPTGSVWQNLRQVIGRPDKSAVMVLLGIVCWSTAWEALDTGLSSIAVFTLGIAPGQASMLSAAGGLAFLLFAIPAGMLGEKYGRGRVIRLGLIGAAILLPVSFLLVNGAVLFVVCVAAAGIMWSLINVNALPLVYDHGEEGKIGAYTGLYYFSSQSAAVLGPVLGGVLVSTLSDQHKFLFLFSAFWMALGWLVMRRVR